MEENTPTLHHFVAGMPKIVIAPIFEPCAWLPAAKDCWRNMAVTLIDRESWQILNERNGLIASVDNFVQASNTVGRSPAATATSRTPS